jgi:hypothetical protein
MDKFRPQSGELHVKEGHQEVDFSIRAIVVFAVFLVISAIGTFIIVGFLINGLEWWEKKHDAQLTPMQEQLIRERAPEAQPQEAKPTLEPDERGKQQLHLEKTFPAPRLQFDDAEDMKELRDSEEKLLNSSGKNPDGSIRIPISRAIDILSQQGLPTVSGPFEPAVPLPVEPAPPVQGPQGRHGR